MKKFAIPLLLILSIALNVVLWLKLGVLTREWESRQGASAEAEDLRRQMGEMEVKAGRETQSVAEASHASELARLRAEVTRLRTELADIKRSTPVAWTGATSDLASNLTHMRQQFTEATQDVAWFSRKLDEVERVVSNTAFASPEELQKMQRRAQANLCIMNLKRIGLAARIWAKEHNEVFPPDFATMKEELDTPTILVCPASPNAQREMDWARFNFSSATYQFVNANGNELVPEKPLTICPIHGSVGLSDGSAQMGRNALK
ncbi:MAG TPA: hypothetical protein VK530_08130 [Candidatus Acidoferrum sp.]|nr:hypothetical protein [Candidatus Acidoferrum sp.]